MTILIAACLIVASLCGCFVLALVSGLIPQRWLWRSDDGGAGFSTGDVDASGEIPLYLEIGRMKGTCWLSRETWEAVGQKAGWFK